jgi:TonB family protein
MKIFQLLLIVLFAAAANAQQIEIEIADGYTLEPMTGFTVSSNNPKLVSAVDGSVVKAKLKDSDMLTVSAEGYGESIINGDMKDVESILLQASPEKIQAMREAAGLSIGEKAYEGVSAAPEKRAQFTGGQQEMFNYLNKNLIYPEDALAYGVSGKIYLKFIVEEDGSISNISVIRGAVRSLDAEARRVILEMPKWSPATNSGQPVRSLCTVPVTFMLE